jgi:hypothetical protein
LRPANLRYQSELSSYLGYFHENLFSALRRYKRAFKTRRSFYYPLRRGEASACYAILERKNIESIYALNPAVKVILMIRNPVERAWSHGIFDFIERQKMNPSQVSDEDLYRHFYVAKYIHDSGKYMDIIAKWKSVVGERNFLIGFYDEIVKAPELLLLRLFKFLGVHSNIRYITAHAKNIINRGLSRNMSDRIRRLLENIYFNELKYIKENFNVKWE